MTAFGGPVVRASWADFSGNSARDMVPEGLTRSPQWKIPPRRTPPTDPKGRPCEFAGISSSPRLRSRSPRPGSPARKPRRCPAPRMSRKSQPPKTRPRNRKTPSRNRSRPRKTRSRSPNRNPKEPKPKEPKPKEPTPSPKAESPTDKIAAGLAALKAKKSGEPQPYDKVIPKDAKTQAGVFAVHETDDKIYFEIPKDKLEKLMLYRAEVAKGPPGTSFNGQELGSKFIRFERRDNKIFVVEANFDKRATDQKAIEGSAVESIIAAFPVAAEGKDRSAVINVTNVFLSDSLDAGIKRAGGNGAVDAERSFIESVKAFPTNIEARAQLTFRASPGGGIPGLPPGLGGGGGGGSKTALIHYSLYLLPETPMQGRFFDPRVGYFTEGFSDYSSTKTWVEDKQYIARYRLEKKDPSKDVSEVVKPITFYLAAEIPAKFRAAMKKGVEDWAPAFEKAGFKNAIVCKDPPSRAEDPNWDPEDARYSVIRWVAEPVANAMGPHVHDPRSGETISAHIIFWHDIQKIVHMWYFTQCSAVDERARSFPFPQELQDELIRYVVAHEVGHTLGLRHNHRASQAYSVEQLRDPKFLEKNGNVASIMSYGRYNYVAQPEDKIPVKDLIPKLAPYDFFAIGWGYKPLPDAKTAVAETKTLNEWANRQIKEPFLRFGGEDGPSTVDPTVLTENIGNDAVAATELGLKNIDRIFGYLLKSTTEPGEEFDTLREAYSAILSHKRNWMNAVLKQVGGVVETRTLGGQGEQFARVPKDKQKQAVEFIIKHGFHTDPKMMDPKIINVLKYSGVASDTITLQRSLLTGLLSASRLNRLLDMEVLDPEKAYPIAELVGDVKAGVWEELKTEAPKVDPIRRALQRTFVETLKAEFNDAPPQQNTVVIGRRTISLGDGGGRNYELRAVARVTLRELKKEIDQVLPKVKDSSTKMHLMDLSAEIADIFETAKK